MIPLLVDLFILGIIYRFFPPEKLDAIAREQRRGSFVPFEENYRSSHICDRCHRCHQKENNSEYYTENLEDC